MSETGGEESESSDLSEEIVGLREDLKGIQERQTKQTEIHRVQRAHLIVAIGVVSAFATLYSSPNEPLKLSVFWKSQQPMYALLLHTILFMVYIPTHLYTITAWSLPTETKSDRLNDFILPFVNLFLLAGSLPLVLLMILQIDLSILPTIGLGQALAILIETMIPLVLFDILIAESVYRLLQNQFIVTPTPTTYIALEVILLTYPAYRHAETFRQNMSQIQTSSRSRRIRISTGSSGDLARVEVKNTTGSRIAGEDIELKIEAPRGVQVDQVGHATGSDFEYTLVDDLDPGDSIRIPISLEPIPGVMYDTIRGETALVRIFIEGEEESVEEFKL